jgi:AcrR family transcriptional regulator
MRCFARKGFANSSMADIIAEAGSSAGSVYSNFTSKAELVRFAASTVLSDLARASTHALPTEETPAQVLARVLRITGDRARAQTLLQIFAEVPRDPELEAFARRGLDELREIIRTAVHPWCRAHAARKKMRPGSLVETVTDALLTAAQGYLVRVTIDKKVDPDRLSARLVAAFHDL